MVPNDYVSAVHMLSLQIEHSKNGDRCSEKSHSQVSDSVQASQVSKISKAVAICS